MLAEVLCAARGRTEARLAQCRCGCHGASWSGQIGADYLLAGTLLGCLLAIAGACQIFLGKLNLGRNQLLCHRRVKHLSRHQSNIVWDLVRNTRKLLKCKRPRGKVVHVREGSLLCTCGKVSPFLCLVHSL